MSDCNICCETFNKSSRKKVECIDCGEICCRKCHQTYLLSKDVIDCMFCNKPQKFEIIKNAHYDTFINSTGSFKDDGFKEHQMEVYFKNEMSMFAETQNEIEREDLLKDLNRQVRILNADYNMINREFLDFKKDEREKHKDKCSCKKMFLRCPYLSDDDRRCLTIKNDEYNKRLNLNLKKADDTVRDIYININSKVNPKNKKKKAVEKCMHNNCDGFLDSDWKCNKCKTTTCKKCREVKGDNHVCNEETLKTIRLALATSKPCPDCNERIHRTYGCDQVYCPLCKIVFSYSTGIKQIGGLIHQPDAVKELRKQGKLHREINDVACGGIQYIFVSKDAKRFDYMNFINLKIIIREIIRWAVLHEDNMLRGEGMLDNTDIFNLNRHERRDYIKGEITKEQYKLKIYNRYKSNELDREVNLLVTGYYTCISDMLRSLELIKGYEDNYNHLNEMLVLINNYNKEFKRVHKTYKKGSLFKQLVLEKISGNKNKNNYYIHFYFGIPNYYEDNKIKYKNKKDLEITDFI